jgi:thioredoxin-related protein
MKKAFIFLIISFMSLTLGSFTPLNKEKNNITIQWLTFEEAVAKSKEKPKKMLIDVYTDWCGWCKKMDKDTYDNALIAQYINENYYAVKFNAEQKESITFDNHTFKFVAQGGRGYHELAASLLQGQMSYPSTVFLDEQFRLIQPLPGYYTAKDFDPILKYFVEGMSKNISFEDYKKTYRSPF